MNPPVIVIDNGAYQCRVGISGELAPRRSFQNAAAKSKSEGKMLFGDMIDNAKVITQLSVRRPFDRGYLVNWDLEADIWARAFKTFLPDVSVSSSSLLMTEPMFNLPAIQRKSQEIVFEHFGFQAMHAMPAPVLAMRQYADEGDQRAIMTKSITGVVLDAGYSFTHAVPIFDGVVQNEGVQRINLGGKALTNLLKELVSFRSTNLKAEGYLVGVIKNTTSFVSLNVAKDLALSHPLRRSQHALEFVLPDGVQNIRGWARDPRSPEVIEQKANRDPMALKEDVCQINNERFMVPEALFSPSDIKLNQAGVCETIQRSINACNPMLHPVLSRNVLLMGGMAACPGFADRVTQDLRPLIQQDCELSVHSLADPMLAAWQGGGVYAQSDEFNRVSVTKAQYMEHGASRRVVM